MAIKFRDVLSHEMSLRSNIQDELTQEKVKNFTLAQQLADERAAFNQLTEQMDRLTDEVEDMEEYIANDDHFIQALQGIIKAHTEKADAIQQQLTAQIQELNSTNELLHAQNHNFSRTIHHLQQQNHDLQEQACSNEEQCSDLKKRIAQLEENHELRMANYLNILCDTLDHRRKLGAMDTLRSIKPVKRSWLQVACFPLFWLLRE